MLDVYLVVIGAMLDLLYFDGDHDTMMDQSCLLP